LRAVFAGRLPKWFGERPGKKKDDPDTPEEEELKKNEEDEEPFGLDDEEAEEEVNIPVIFTTILVYDCLLNVIY
jgi:hypothetical protein